MKIPERPHYSKLIEGIWKHEKSNAPDLEKRKSERAGNCLADILMNIFDNENELSNLAKQNLFFDKPVDCYSLSINKEFFCIGFNVSPFSECLDYNFENENELWRLINDVFGENGKYKNQDSFDSFKKYSKNYGFDFIKCPVINNSNNTLCLKLEFKILKELPKFTE